MAADEVQDIDRAIRLYQDAAQLFELLIPQEVDTDTKLQLVSQREQIQSRLEALTKNSAQSSEAAHSEQDRQADQSPQNEAPPLASAPLNAPNSLVPVAPRWLSFDILFSVERVKVYILYGNQRELINDGTVAALRILKGTESSNLGDIAILQLNLSTFVPLSKEIPCLRFSVRHYVLPRDEDSFYGIAFPDKMPPQLVKAFEDHMEMLSNYKKNNVEITIDEPSEEVVVRETSEAVAVSAPATASDGLVGKIIQAIGIGSKFVASGVVTTGNLVRSGLERGGELIASKISPRAEPASVPEPLKGTVLAIKAVSPVAVEVSSVMVEGISVLAKALTRMVASRMQPKEGLNNGKLKVAAAIGSAAVSGFCTIWDSLSEAGIALFTGAQNASSTIVDKRFGEDAANLVRDGFDVGKDIFMVGKNIHELGFKSIVKTVGKSAVTTWISEKESRKVVENLPNSTVRVEEISRTTIEYYSIEAEQSTSTDLQRVIAPQNEL